MIHLPKGEKLFSEFSPESHVPHCVPGWLQEASENRAGIRFNYFLAPSPARKVVMAWREDCQGPLCSAIFPRRPLVNLKVKSSISFLRPLSLKCQPDYHGVWHPAWFVFSGTDLWEDNLVCVNGLHSQIVPFGEELEFSWKCALECRSLGCPRASRSKQAGAACNVGCWK